VPDRTTIATYLHFGFLPKVDPRPLERTWSRIHASDVLDPADVDRRTAIARGAEAFRDACRAELVWPAAGPHVVPLSGGIDSRMILAALVQLGRRERIEAVTFGIPGTWDFDLAPLVARAAGVRHHAIDLSTFVPSRRQLLRTLRRAPWTFPLEVAWNHVVFDRIGSHATYWSGSQANVLAGEGADEDIPDWDRARQRFAALKGFSHAVSLTPPGFRPEQALPARPILEDSCLNAFRQLHLFVRNPSRNDPAQIPEGFDVRTPFHGEAWVDFILRYPEPILEHGRFYHEIAAHLSPELFALPTKNYLGHPVHAPAWRVQLRRARLKAERLGMRHFPRLPWPLDPKTNYVDFDGDLRAATPLRALVEPALCALAQRDVVDWLDPLELWDLHQSRRANLGDALTLLASLELVLLAAASPAAGRRGAPARLSFRSATRSGCGRWREVARSRTGSGGDGPHRAAPGPRGTGRRSAAGRHPRGP
jgi:hypothetical protein